MPTADAAGAAASALAPARDLLAFIDASPSPWHAVAAARQRLLAGGFAELRETERWRLAPGGRYFTTRGESSLIAFVVGAAPLAEAGLRLIGAHTDSPGLRVKPRAPHVADGMVRLGVEVYGGPILATFADRDLGLAGRVHLRDGSVRLLHIDRPILRLPNLAIHMNREVNESGLKFNKQTELPLLLGIAEEGRSPDQVFAAALGLDAGDIRSWELAVCDTQKGALWGPGEEFIAASRLDNLASCHAALSALVALPATPSSGATAVCALFDHEEVGSESAAGAGGSFVLDVITRLAAAQGVDAEDQRRALANSFFISADMAHGWHPNFPAAYEPQHRVLINGGPVIKHNANQRYSTGGDTAARFIALCEKAGVPWQQYAHRSDLGCGSTIGPIVAARLGVPSVDVGNPMWAMHSLRESAGALDHGRMIEVFGAAFAS